MISAATKEAISDSVQQLLRVINPSTEELSFTLHVWGPDRRLLVDLYNTGAVLVPHDTV